ncbi:MAG: O-acetyl-ADP-ribose deacetylase [Halanaerobiales bacterium]|nr:O-acetyl-ADP-ribose deacetylase [Halanaerobiales bacterium]
MVQSIIGKTRLQMLVGDITNQDTEAIVNAANPTLMGGGGVDGAIHRAGGPQILKECKEIRKKQGKCPPGEAVITSGGELIADYVIHTVGPIWHGGNSNEEEILADAYRNSLTLALKNKIKSVAFPSISTGAYRFPIERAARIALGTIRDFIRANQGLNEVRMVLYSQQDFEIYLSAWEDIITNNRDV